MNKVYIASPWKNSDMLVRLANYLRAFDLEVDCFCDPSLVSKVGRFVFNFKDVPEFAKGDGKDEIDVINHPYIQAAFKDDKKWLDWCDICLLVLPAGKSSHLEAGYAKGCGKRLFIYGEFEKGQYDVMYGFADGMFREGHLSELIMALTEPIDRCICCHKREVSWPRVCDDCQDKNAQATLEGMGAEQCRSCGMYYDGGMRCTYCGDADPTDSGEGEPDDDDTGRLDEFGGDDEEEECDGCGGAGCSMCCGNEYACGSEECDFCEHSDECTQDAIDQEKYFKAKEPK